MTDTPTKDDIRRDKTARMAAYMDAEPDAAAFITRHVLKEEWRDHTVALYVPHNAFTEIDLEPLMRHLQANDCHIALPHVTDRGQPFKFYNVTIRDGWQKDLVRDASGMLAPAPTLEVYPDEVIAPCVAFDSEGNRLGHGMGGYDRAMEKLRRTKPEALLIGVAYSGQEFIGTLPTEPHDVKFDAVFLRSGKVKPLGRRTTQALKI